RRQLSLESLVVGLRAVVLQPASDLRLLGLLTAAPHGVDPLQRRRGAGTDGVSAAPFMWSWFVVPTVHGRAWVRPSSARAAAHSACPAGTRAPWGPWDLRPLFARIGRVSVSHLAG